MTKLDLPDHHTNADSLLDIAAWPEVLNSIEVGVTVISPDLRLEFINDTYRKIVDIPDEIRPGDAAFELYLYTASRGDYGEGEPERLANEKLRAIADGKWSDGIHQMSNGRINRIRRDLLDNGYIVTTITDITDIRQGEIRISENEKLMSSVLEATDQGIMIVDRLGTAEMVNSAYIDMLGFGENCNSEPQSYFELIKGAWKEGKFYSDEINNMSEEEFLARTVEMVEKSSSEPQMLKLANERYVRFSSRDIENDRRIFTFTDVTDSKMREIAYNRARKESEDMLVDFRAAINNMDIGLLLLDANLNSVIVNDAFHKIWNTSDAEFSEGTPMRDFIEVNRGNGIYDVEDDDWDEYVQLRVEEIGAGDIAPREMVRADGKTLIYSCISLTGGQRLVQYSDVTEFKQREAALERAQAKAQIADRSKSEFLANMSHEIRTPMNGVMGMAELLAKSELNSKQKMFTEVILSSSSALLTIINDILDFSKIEAGKLELDPAEFDLSAAIEDVATLVSTSVNEKNLELIVRVQPDLPDRVVGDVGRIRQILTNLVGNAVKFTESGHVFVDVSGHVKDGAAGLKFTIEDTGIGIPEGQLKTVFDKFSQVDGSSTRRHEGTGLGLAITSRLVELMDGVIGCESTLGEGSKFWFAIEVPVGVEVVDKPPQSIDISGSRILAIDDNKVNRSILLEQFSAWHLDGAEAASGLEGLAMLRQACGQSNPFDLIVLDYHMPDMNGIDVARVIRNDEDLQATAIVMLTSVDNVGETTEFKQLDIEAHLTKPARASQLLENIVDVISAKRRREGKTPFHKGDSVEVVAPELKTPKASVSRTAIQDALMLDDVQSLIAVAENTVMEEQVFAETSKIDILVAEDNEVNQMVFEQILTHLNYQFKIVGNGKLAVDEIDQLRPTIVLMDVSMPVMNGHDATAEIRKMYNSNDPSDYRPTIIGVTAHALKDDREKCIEAGMDDYMSKPISPDKLAEKIIHWMPDSRTGDGSDKITA